MIAMKPIKSSNIEAVGYDKEKQELHVTFKGSGTYVYANVPQAKHTALLGAESVGSFFHTHIKPSHPGVKKDAVKTQIG